MLSKNCAHAGPSPLGCRSVMSASTRTKSTDYMTMAIIRCANLLITEQVPAAQCENSVFQTLSTTNACGSSVRGGILKGIRGPGLRMISQSMAREYGPLGIRCCACCH